MIVSTQTTIADRILVFVPAHNCQDQIGRVIEQLEAEWARRVFAQVIVVDNRSTDGTAEVVAGHVARIGGDYIRLLVNDANYGLGGSHKVAFQYAARNGFDWLVVLHGDDQGSVADFRDMIERRAYRDHDAVLGSRFMRGASTHGYSAFRIFGNHVFNLIYSACIGRRVLDLGAGLNMYRVASLRQEQILRYPDNLTFNCVMLCAQAINGDRIAFAPVSWREDDQVSNVKLVRQSIETLKIALFARFGRRSFVCAEHRRKLLPTYSWTVANV